MSKQKLVYCILFRIEITLITLTTTLIVNEPELGQVMIQESNKARAEAVSN